MVLFYELNFYFNQKPKHNTYSYISSPAPLNEYQKAQVFDKFKKMNCCIFLFGRISVFSCWTKKMLAFLVSIQCWRWSDTKNHCSHKAIGRLLDLTILWHKKVEDVAKSYNESKHYLWTLSIAYILSEILSAKLHKHDETKTKK